MVEMKWQRPQRHWAAELLAPVQCEQVRDAGLDLFGRCDRTQFPTVHAIAVVGAARDLDAVLSAGIYSVPALHRRHCYRAMQRIVAHRYSVIGRSDEPGGLVSDLLLSDLFWISGEDARRLSEPWLGPGQEDGCNRQGLLLAEQVERELEIRPTGFVEAARASVLLLAHAPRDVEVLVGEMARLYRQGERG